jgi:hypothetical protein
VCNNNLRSLPVLSLISHELLLPGPDAAAAPAAAAGAPTVKEYTLYTCAGVMQFATEAMLTAQKQRHGDN